MERKYTKRAFLDALEKRVMIYDGANGTSLQNMNLTAEHFGGEKYNGAMDYLAITYPQAVEDVHRSFFEVGVDIVETNTFRSNPLTLAEYGLEDQTIEINRTSVSIARKVADEFSTPDHPRFVAGSIGPSGYLPSANDPALSNVTYDQLVDVFAEQAEGLILGGADILLIETSQDILEVKATIDGIQAAFEKTGEYLPIQCQVTLDTSGRMLLGTDIGATLTILESLPIDIIGLNCSTGPEHMLAPISYLGEHATLPVSAIPNAGLPLNVDGEAVYPLEPIPYAESMYEYITKHNVNIVGGCCGTTPEHLKLLVDKVHNHPAPARPQKQQAHLSSSIGTLAMAQEPRPLLIGERLNATGSRKFKRLLLNEDFDAMVTLARDQIAGGAHALDISVAITETANEKEMMSKLVKLLAMGVEAPLVIDSTEYDVMEAALKIAPGRCLLNSTHLEAGRPKMDAIFKLAKKHNAAVLILTIDEDGMAKTVERKLEIAKRIYDIATKEFGLRPEDLVYDTLTFPLSTGDPEFANSALATIESIKRIKEELPGVFTSLGVSNVSFGLSKAARPVLNSLMLYHSVQAGLDMAIVHASKIKPYPEIPSEEREIINDLIFNKHPDALQKVIEFYEGVQVIDEKHKNPTEDMTSEEALYWSILNRFKEGLESAIDEVVHRDGPGSQDDKAVDLLNNTLLPAMKEVGDRFGRGDLILPFVLQSAEVMKKAVSHLENYLEQTEGTSKGRIVLATVYGDVHDIGKNLVNTILSNNGYEVFDLGKQVPADKIIEKAIEVNATAIGLSALLVSTSKQMTFIVNQLNKKGLNIPVLIGGAAINRRFGWRILYTDNGDKYPGGVFYCSDAFEGLETVEQIIHPEKKISLFDTLDKKAKIEKNRSKNPTKKKTRRNGAVLEKAAFIPSPQKWGERIVKELPLETVFGHLYINELYRLSWGAKNKKGEEWETIKNEFDARLARMKKDALDKKWLNPQGVYGYWPAQSEGDELIVFDPASINSASPKEITRFSFPRQTSGDGLALSDYYASVKSGIMDTVAFQVVTVGKEASQLFDKLQKADDYTEAYFTHGLAVQTAEAAAEYMHRHIRKELKLSDDQGKRYSWGYPAIPDLADHAKVFDLLPVTEALGLTLTESYQLVPEQSTAAIIVHHSNAKYFTAGDSRVDQLSS
jgi:5-methyltetrahydrofolate--homocysteine methyltransferase